MMSHEHKLELKRRAKIELKRAQESSKELKRAQES